jgi:hypothetical protein
MSRFHLLELGVLLLVGLCAGEFKLAFLCWGVTN